MKKLLTVVALLIFALGALALTACSSAQDEELVGTWRFEGDGSVTYVFDADGTGSRNTTGRRETFTWSTSGDRLNVNRDTRDSYLRNERWNYTITDYALTIDSRQERNWVYTFLLDSGEQNEALLNTWHLEGGGETLVLNEDGTGTRGTAGDMESITWSTTGNRLDIRSRQQAWGVEWERWTFTVTDYSLNLNSQQATGLSLDYRLDSGGQQSVDLVGTWRWDDYGGYIYVFDADGTGTRGFIDDMETFTWSTSDDTLYVNRDQAPLSEIRNERWTFTIANYALTLNSQQERNLVYTYLFDSGEQSAVVVGTWAWDEYDGYTYTFNADGTGTRGVAGDMESITWSTTGNRIDIRSPLFAWGIEWERWTFTITGDSLNLNSQQADGLSFDYIRR